MRWASTRWFSRCVLGLLSLLYVGLGLTQAWTDSLTFDEAPNLAEGLSALVHRDLRVNPEHPVLPAALAALPALVAQPNVPKGQAWQENRYFDYSAKVVAAQVEDGTLRRVLFLSRLVPLAIGVGCAVLLYLLASRLTGPPGGLLAGGLWLTIPVVQGYGHLNGIDIPFAFGVLLVALMIDRHGQRPSVGRAVALGGAVGVAMLTRHTGLVLVPLAASVVGWRARADRPLLVRSGAAVLLVPVALVWATYRGIDPSGPPPEVRAGFEQRLGAAQDASPVAGRAARALPLPLEYRAGLAKLIADDEPRAAYLLGHAWTGSQPWYFPAVALVKLPTTTLLAVLVGAATWWAACTNRRRALIACVAPAAVLAAVLALQPLNLGLRYALPVVALALVAAAPLATSTSRPGRVLLLLVVIGQLAATLSAHPHAIAWTSPPFRPEHRVVSDGDLDIGQWHREVTEWAEGNDVVGELLAARGLPRIGRPLDEGPIGDAWVAVSASALTVYQRDELSWLRAYCPVRTLGGGAVLVYRFDREPDRSEGPVRPAGLCTGRSTSVRTG